MTIGIMPALLGTVEFVTGVFAFELVKPSSVVVTGSGSESATISALGSVEFSAATALSLNDVFSSGYDNYMISIRHVLSSSNAALRARLRASGSDATGTDYTLQYLSANNTTVSGARASSSSSCDIGGTSATARSGDTLYIYGPYLAQPTALRNVSCYGNSSAYIYDVASTHSLSTAYDGLTIFPQSGTLSGRVAVYGMRG